MELLRPQQNKTLVIMMMLLYVESRELNALQENYQMHEITQCTCYSMHILKNDAFLCEYRI